MADFRFVAVDSKTGQRRSGTWEASDLESARQRLTSLGLRVERLEAMSPAPGVGRDLWLLAFLLALGLVLTAWNWKPLSGSGQGTAPFPAQLVRLGGEIVGLQGEARLQLRFPDLPARFEVPIAAGALRAEVSFESRQAPAGYEVVVERPGKSPWIRRGQLQGQAPWSIELGRVEF